jgi:cell division protein FtsA
LVQEEIKKSGLTNMLGSGVVLTGGTSQLAGLIEMGEFVFDVPVRKGAPQKINGLGVVVRSPVYSTALGLIAYGIKMEKRTFISAGKGIEWKGFMGNWAQKIRDLLGGSL